MCRFRALLVSGVAAVALAGPVRGAAPPLPPPAVPLLDIDNSAHFDANDLDMIVTNHGALAFDVSTGGPGLTFPRGSDKHVVYASGLWMGAKVDGQVRVTIAEYSQEYGPGSILSGGAPAPASDPCFHVYKMSASRTTWPDYLRCAYPYGPPVDTSARGYDADDRSTWMPQLFGDQTLWAVYSDADSSRHTNRAGNSAPLGIQVEQTVFGFDRQAPLGNVIFMQFMVRNRGAHLLESAYLSFWVDPDLGYPMDDLVGCDTLLNLGYCYNSALDDQVYGSTPPAVGYDLLEGPIVPSQGGNGLVAGRLVPGYRNLPMTSFNKYINGTDPRSAEASYSHMKGLNPDGTPVVDEVTGRVTTYAVPGDPVAGTGWLDGNANDRRMMLSSGPFTMAPGDSQEVVVAVIVARSENRLASVRLLKQYDEAAQAVFDTQFYRLPAEGAFSLVAPASNDTLHTTRPTVRWHAAARRSPAAVGYTLTWSLDPSFSTSSLSVSVPDTVYTFPPGVLIAHTTYYWRVYASVAGLDRFCEPPRGWSFYIEDDLPPVVATVFPGDTNNDGLVDIQDILPLGFYFGLTGAARPGASLQWSGQPLYGAWSPPLACFADGNGDGVVNASDVDGIIENWNSVQGAPRLEVPDRGAICYSLLRSIDEQPGRPGFATVRLAVVDYLERLTGTRLAFRVSPPEPNPFGQATTLRFTIPSPVAAMELAVFNARGTLTWMRTVPGPPIGPGQLTWDGRDSRGVEAPAGIYFYRFTAGAHRAAGKVTLVRQVGRLMP
jgi:hypothetical protein